MKRQPLAAERRGRGLYRCLAQEEECKQTTGARWRHTAPLDPERAVFGAWLNKCFVYEEDV